MQKIAVILAVGCFGLTNADLPPNCLKPNLFLDVNKCCFQFGNTPYDAAIANCYNQFAATSDPKFCVVNCAVAAIGLGSLKTGLNNTVLAQFFKTYVNDSVLINYMTLTLKNCVTQVMQMMQKPQYNTVSSPCNPAFGYIHDCTSLHAILNCPAEKWKTGDSYCEQIRTDISTSCPYNY